MDDKLHRDWHELMATLKRHCMQSVYAALVGHARSEKHLEQMHNALPDNCQLMREDFIILRRAVRALWSGTQPHGEQMPQMMLDNLVNMVRGRATLFSYYGKKLGDRRKLSDTIYTSFWKVSRLFAHAHQHDHQFSTRFVVWMIGIPFMTECVILNGSHGGRLWETMLVRMAVNKVDLTEPMVHQIRSEGSMMSSFCDDSDIWRNTTVPFPLMDFSLSDQTTFVLSREYDADNMGTHLRTLNDEAWCRGDKLLLRGGCDVLKNVLIAQTNLPITRVGRIVDPQWRIKGSEVIRQNEGGSRYGIIFDN